MQKRLIGVIIALSGLVMATIGASAATTHKVVSGDSMWKIAVKYEEGHSEIIGANPHVSNTELI